MKTIFFYLFIVFILICGINQKSLEEKMNNCIIYLSKEASVYNETYNKLKYLDEIYINNEKIRLEEKFKIYRKFNSERKPGYLPESYINDESFLLTLNEQKGIIKINDLKPSTYLISSNKHELLNLFNNIYLWKGDITRLKIDAIVNAANNQLLGCWHPLHNCIDNIIHSYAGVQLRNEMNEIMLKQGKLEETGKAKISKGYYLLADYIIHTVGPIVNGPLLENHKKLLKSSYINVIKLAKENNIKTLAFCCISTGIFNFPNEEAADIAINVVLNYLENNTNMKFIFVVYKDIDEKIYRNKLKEKMNDILNNISDEM